MRQCAQDDPPLRHGPWRISINDDETVLVRCRTPCRCALERRRDLVAQRRLHRRRGIDMHGVRGSCAQRKAAKERSWSCSPSASSPSHERCHIERQPKRNGVRWVWLRAAAGAGRPPGIGASKSRLSLLACRWGDPPAVALGLRRSIRHATSYRAPLGTKFRSGIGIGVAGAISQVRLAPASLARQALFFARR